MIVTPDELAAIARQAVAEYPNESCGVVVARGPERRVVPCRNIQSELHAKDPVRYPRDARTAYFMDSKDALTWNRLLADGFELAVIYHSHPNAGSYFSETDAAQALMDGEPAYPDVTYLVVSVVADRARSAAAYRWEGTARRFVRVDGGELVLDGEDAMKDSIQLYAAAERVIPGGVNSPVRAFRGVGGQPFFVSHARGSRLTDVDGREYIDFLGSWGPMILGHAPAAVIEAVTEAAKMGTSYGAPTPAEVEMAEAITAAYPSMEMMRLVSSGTEAAMSAIRLARGATGRDVLVKFDGCYHGHADSLLVKAGSGGATFGIPDSRGVPAALAQLTVTVPFNDLDAIRDVFRARGHEIAAVIVEPVAGNMGVVPPRPDFLAGLRELCREHGAVLIFDEVITGFRVAYGGAQALYGVRPDLTCLGKIIGGGLPVGAYGGRRDLMSQVAPLGGVYQAGTLSGNPLAVAAGLATLRALSTGDPYARLEALGARLARGLAAGAEKAGVPVRINRVGSMLTGFFTADPVTDYATAKRADTARYARFFHGMLERGVFLAASQFEAAFVSLAHTEADVDATARAAGEVLAAMS
ncbi:MAG: glutamate-1-semialdehyde 2,1-aminomutase [Candidatus Rokubacteria bacterium]|nr:glutamate-1-semialdehyde 2,1-aminomutase [Candidatus Rokubacteria bacterium]